MCDIGIHELHGKGKNGENATAPASETCILQVLKDYKFRTNIEFDNVGDEEDAESNNGN